MNDHSWLTMVALNSGVLPPIEDVFAVVRTTAPHFLDGAAVTDVRSTGRIATCRWGDAVVGVTLIERPIPKSAFDGPCANAWYWPAAEEVVVDHTAHLLVQLVDESRDAVEAALRLTALTAATAQVTDAAAILWAPAGLVHEPRAFAEQAAGSNRESLPLYLWIDFRVRRQEDGRFDVFTTGLARFGKRELELTPVAAPAQQVLEWAYNLAHFVLDRTSVIKDGDTAGLPDGTQFTVEHTTSRIDAKTEALSLTRMEPSAG